MSTGITCTVYAAGVRVADGSPGDDDTAPTALSGLRVTWGRETTVDQPQASTCTFDVLDPVAAGVILDRRRRGAGDVPVLSTGTPIDVVATGTVYPDPTASTFLDPSFEDGIVAAITTAATATVSTRRAATGAQSLRIHPTDADRAARVILAPAPFVPVGSLPGAWDEIAQAQPGQQWSAGATVYAPVGAVVELLPVLFTGPWRTAGTVLDTPTQIVHGDGQWHTVAATFSPNAANVWVGLEVTVYPAGFTWDDVDPALTWDDVDPALTWDDTGDTYVDDVAVLAPEGGVASSVLVFSGRVTSLVDEWDDEADAPLVQVTCADFTADLDNRDVGDEPWLVETVADRMQRILDLAGAPVSLTIPDTLADTLVSWRDVDSQPAMGLLTTYASTVDGVLWSATHQTTGPYLELEDPAARASLSVLEVDPDTGLVVIVTTGGSADALDLSACDVLRDDVAWTQDTQDVTTRVAVTWKLQGTDDDGKNTTTDTTYTVVNDALEAELGSRRLSLSSELQAEDDAADVAARILARTAVIDWRASGIAVDDDDLDEGPGDVAALLRVLDGTTRNGLPIRLTDVPEWAPVEGPAPVYLEGGTFEFAEGRWVVDLTVSSATALGQSAAWDDLDPAWTWDDLDPAITWDDLRGVGVATTEGA